MATVETEDAATLQAQGRYLYAVVDGVADRQAFAFRGMDGAEVYALVDDGIAAIVSDAPVQRLRPERRKLAAHHDVLKQLMADHATLPMSFGLVADGVDAVRRILRLNRPAFRDQLDRVRGKVEMGLRVVWDVPNIFEYAIVVHPELGELRDHLFRGGREPSQDEKIELGRLFDRCVTADREEYAEKVNRILQNRCAEIVTNPPRNEREVMNLACLVDRDRQRDFEQGVIEAAKFFDNNFAFDFNGPWPAHNFVDIDLRMS